MTSSHISFARLPHRFHGEMGRYIDYGVEPGSFLIACLTNNLVEAFGRADHESETQIKSIVSWLYNDMPTPLWGSPEKVAAHMKRMNENGRRYDE